MKGKSGFFLCKILLAVSVFLTVSCSALPQLTEWTANQESAVIAAIGSIDTNRIWQYLTNLDGIRSVESTNALQPYEDFLTNTLRSWGYTVTLQPVTASVYDYSRNVYTNALMNNIIAVKTGNNPSLAPAVVCAHWDSVVMGPGMDDNASGCAGLLEIARIAYGLNLSRSVVFILTAFEEHTMKGAFTYAASLGSNPDFMINFDMIGVTSAEQQNSALNESFAGMPHEGNFIHAIGDSSSSQLVFDFTRISGHFVPELPYYSLRCDANLINNPLLSSVLRSDHLAFWAKSVPSLFFTDGAEYRNSFYHTSEDKIGTLDLVFLSRVVKSSMALLLIRTGLPQ